MKPYLQLRSIFSDSILTRGGFLLGILPLILFATLGQRSAIADPDVSIDEVTPYKLGVFPFVSLSRLEALFAPIAEDIEASLGREVKLRSSSSFELFMEKLEKQNYDIAFIQPFDYIRIGAGSGYIPLVSRTEELSAVLVVGIESPVQEIGDLKGRIVGLPPKVAAVSYLTQVVLHQAGFDLNKDITFRHFRSHDSCLQQLLIGAIDVCGTAPVPLSLYEQGKDIKFRVIKRSPIIESALFVVHSRINASDQDIIRNVLLARQASTTAGDSLRHAALTFKTVEDSNYDIVREFWQEIR